MKFKSSKLLNMLGLKSKGVSLGGTLTTPTTSSQNTEPEDSGCSTTFSSSTPQCGPHTTTTWNLNDNSWTPIGPLITSIPYGTDYTYIRPELIKCFSNRDNLTTELTDLLLMDRVTLEEFKSMIIMIRSSDNEITETAEAMIRAIQSKSIDMNKVRESNLEEEVV